MLILSGFLAGIVSGMGIGGGSILIPILIIFLNINQHTAQGINLLYFIPTAIIALIVHFKNKQLAIKTSIYIIIFGTIGALIGSFTATTIKSEHLRKAFAIFLFLMGIYELYSSLNLSKEKNNKNLT